MRPLHGSPRARLQPRGPNGTYDRLHSVYDEGVQRSKVLLTHNGTTAIEFAGAASPLYSIDRGELSGPAFRRLDVAPDGLTLASSTQNLINGAIDIKFDAGLFYASNGKVINPASASIVGDFGPQGTAALVAPDSESKRVFFLTGNLFGGDFIRAEMVKAFLDSDEYQKRFGQ